MSACETAKGGAKQPYQAINAKRVYEELFYGDAEPLDPDNNPHALDEAMRNFYEDKGFMLINGPYACAWVCRL